MSVIGNPIIVGKKPEQTKTVSPSTSQQIVTPDSGKVLSSVTVNAAVLQEKTVTPTASGFTVSPDSGKYGLSSVKVNGNSNLVAGNIKSGVTIFGVTGSYDPVTSAIVISGLVNTDTVTCSGGGKSYSATWDATARHWEIVGLPLGTFSLTATNGAKTTTATVLIDVTGVYEVEMTLKLWLYKDGDECESITGGWSNSGYSRPDWSVASGVKNSDNMLVGQDPGAENQYRMFGTVNAIDCSVYNTLKIQLKPFKVNSYNSCLEIWTGTTKAFPTNASFRDEVTGKSAGITYDYTLSYSLNGSRYIALCGGRTGSYQYGSYIYKVWLE